MGVEVAAQVQPRMRKQTPMPQQQGDQQPSNAAVPIKERVDGLELVVDQPDTNQAWQLRRCMKVLLKLIEALVHVVDRRGNIGGVFQRAPGRTDPILTAPGLTRGSVLPSQTLQ